MNHINLPSAFITLSLLISGLFAQTAIAYNSDEHMQIADFGAAAVDVPTGINLPIHIGIAPVKNYVENIKAAKQLSVGFSSNDEKQYSRWSQAQDNCYWHNYGQRNYNMEIWIPSPDKLPQNVFHVLANTTDPARSMTFGQMVALYGDYRRTPYCDAAGNCYLTNANTAEENFTGNIVRKDKYCPPSMATQDYLRRIGAGLVPPFGTLGNETANTAKDNEYHEAGWWGDEMLRLANVNDWHFSNAAVAWYTGMHRLALLSVEQAVKDPRYWNQALHYEANALHSLTDLFAFGHVVTNRGETSFGIMASKDLLNTTTFKWAENVVGMGGGARDASGRVYLNGALPDIANTAHGRNDLLKSYRGTWANRAKNEKTYHDYFNKTGATVRNLKGDKFFIYGDGKLHLMEQDAQNQISEAVRSSVQSLFDAYQQIAQQGKSIHEIGATGSSYFSALQYIPVYIDDDKDGYFKGRWTSYALFAKNMSGSDKALKNFANCQVPYLSGKDLIFWPKVHLETCTDF